MSCLTKSAPSDDGFYIEVPLYVPERAINTGKDIKAHYSTTAAIQMDDVTLLDWGNDIGYIT